MNGAGAGSDRRVGVLLVHGMGRTLVSFALLGLRLRRAGLQVAFFGYSATIEPFEKCVERLTARLRSLAESGPYLVVGHSLGATLLRAALPNLTAAPPAACFLLAPPSQPSRLARMFAPKWLYRVLTGDMGQRLADPAFLAALPPPASPTTIYSGTRGPRGRLSAFGDEPNDGILAVSETRIDERYPVVALPAIHTFIMNSRRVASDILKAAQAARRAP